MKEKDFMKQVAQINMPDIENVRNVCVDRLNEERRGKRKNIRLRRIAAVIAIFACLIIIPVNVIAGKKGNRSEVKIKDNANDLVYRETDGASLSLTKGDTINISATEGQEYKDVYIILIGKEVEQEIGVLSSDTSYSYTVSVTGEYMIYSAESKENITNEVVIEYNLFDSDGIQLLE